jgi:hypothetical protein
VLWSSALEPFPNLLVTDACRIAGVVVTWLCWFAGSFFGEGFFMKTFCTLAMAAASALFVGTLWAQAPGAGRTKGQPAAKPETYAVFKIGDDLSVDKQSSLKDKRKKEDDDYKKAVADYNKDVKEAAKSKDKSALPKRPVKRLVKIIKGQFKTKDDADSWLKDWKEKHSNGKTEGASTSKKTANSW